MKIFYRKINGVNDLSELQLNASLEGKRAVGVSASGTYYVLDAASNARAINADSAAETLGLTREEFFALNLDEVDNSIIAAESEVSDIVIENKTGPANEIAAPTMEGYPDHPPVAASYCRESTAAEINDVNALRCLPAALAIDEILPEALNKLNSIEAHLVYLDEKITVLNDKFLVAAAQVDDIAGFYTEVFKLKDAFTKLIIKLK